MQSKNSGFWLPIVLGALISGLSYPAQASPYPPYIYSYPYVIFYITNADGSSAPELTYDTDVVQAPFYSSSTTGAGVAGAYAYINQTSIGGEGYVTTNGFGSASASFGVEQVTTVTNTGSADGNYILNYGYFVNTSVSAYPFAGQTMSYNWSIGFVSPYLYEGYESQSHVCDAANPDYFSCVNFYDYNYDSVPFTIDAGQSVPFDMVMDFNLHVSSVPEPGSLALFATALAGLGVVCRRRSTHSQRLS